MKQSKGTIWVGNIIKPEAIDIDSDWATQFLWHETLCMSCNWALKTCSIDAGWEYNVVYEVKGEWKNKYIEVLWIQVKIQTIPNPLMTVSWLEDGVSDYMTEILWDVNDMGQDKINVSEFILWSEWLNKKTKAYFKKQSGWYMQLNIKNDR